MTDLNPVARVLAAADHLDTNAGTYRRAVTFVPGAEPSIATVKASEFARAVAAMLRDVAVGHHWPHGLPEDATQEAAVAVADIVLTGNT